MRHRLSRQQLAAIWLKRQGIYSAKYAYAQQLQHKSKPTVTALDLTGFKFKSSIHAQKKQDSGIEAKAWAENKRRDKNLEARAWAENKKRDLKYNADWKSAIRSEKSREAYKARKKGSDMGDEVPEFQRVESKDERKRRLKNERKAYDQQMKDAQKYAAGEQAIARGQAEEADKMERARLAGLSGYEREEERKAKEIAKKLEIKEREQSIRLSMLSALKNLFMRVKHLDSIGKEADRKWRSDSGSRRHLNYRIRYAVYLRDLMRIIRDKYGNQSFINRSIEQYPYKGPVYRRLKPALRRSMANIRSGKWLAVSITQGTDKVSLNQLV